MSYDLLFAILAALGAMIFASSLAATFANFRLSKLVPRRQVDLEREFARYGGQVERQELGFFERTVLLPLGNWYAQRATNATSFGQKLDLLFWPPGYSSMTEYYMRKVFYTLAGFALGFIVFILFQQQLGVIAFLVPPIFSFVGFRQADSQIDSMMRDRREAMVFELKPLLDSLTIAYQSRNSLNAAVVEVLANIDQDGYLSAELRRAMNLSIKGKPFDEALAEASRRCVDCALASQILYQLSYTVRFGTDLIKPLSDAGNMATAMLTTALIARGRQNEIAMLLPLFLPLMGIAVAMAGPALYLFLTTFG